MAKIEDYIPFVEFIGAALGKNYEVVLHDLTNPDHSIVAIVNGEISGRTIGGPVTDFVLKILKKGNLEHKPYLAHYHGKNVNGHVCLSSSFFILDENKKTIGVLCINHNISPYIAARQFLSEEIIQDHEGENNRIDFPASASADSINIFENFQGNVNDVITTIINTALNKYDVEPSRLSLKERLTVIAELNNNGLFLLKGGIPAISQKLRVSEPTVYRYISKIKKKTEV